MKPQRAIFQERNCLTQALLNLCSPRRLLDERGHGSFWLRFWLPNVGLQAYLILASCRASFNTYVWIERHGSGISHFAHSQSRPLPEVRESSKWTFVPIGRDPSLTFNISAVLQCFLWRRLCSQRLCQQNAWEQFLAHFETFLPTSLPATSSSFSLFRNLDDEKWPKLGGHPYLNTHMPSGSTLRGVCDPSLFPSKGARVWFHQTGHSKALCNLSCCLCNLQTWKQKKCEPDIVIWGPGVPQIHQAGSVSD